MTEQHGATTHRINAILDGLSSVVLFFNGSGELEYVNSAGRAMLGNVEQTMRFCDVVDCCGMTYINFIKSIRSGDISSQVRYQPGIGASDRQSCLNILPLDNGLLCTSGFHRGTGPQEIWPMYKAIYQESSDAIFIIRPGTWQIITANAAAGQLTGYACQKLSGASYDLLIPVHDQDNVRQALIEINNHREKRGYSHIERKDGSTVPIEFTAREIVYDNNSIIAIVAQDTTDAEKAKVSISRKNNELSTLNYISSLASSSANIDEILERSLYRACAVTGMPMGCILLMSREESILTHSAFAGIEDDRIKAAGSIRIGEYIEGRVAKSGLIEIVEDTVKSPGQASDTFANEEIGSIVSVPIWFGGKVLGVMDLAAREKRTFSPEDARFFVNIANTIGSAVYNVYCVGEVEAREAENTQLIRNMGKRTEEMTLNYEIQRKITQDISLEETLDSIVKNVPRLLNLSYCVIFLLENGDNKIVSIKASEPVEKKHGKLKFEMKELIASKEAIDKKCAIVMEDTRTFKNVSRDIVRILDARTGMILPLIARGKVLGVIWIYDTNGPRKFNENDVQRANVLSDQIAVAIDNAMLFSQLSSTNKQLEESYQRLKSLDMMKMEFFTLVSHELRTPLTTIKGYAELLQDGMLGPLNEEQRDKLARINSSVDRLTSIVDNLSDLSSIASKRYIVEVIPVSLNDLINEVVRGITFLAESKEIKLIADIPADLPVVYVDRAKIMQVILNILNNAIKYTPRGGVVTITAKDEEENIIVAVHDTGIGIPKKDLENIFSGFYHAGYKLSYEYKGAGLGLALSKGIIESHGGRIWAESEEGNGSTFYFTLPKKPLKYLESKDSKNHRDS